MYKLFLDDVRVPSDVCHYCALPELKPLYNQPDWQIVRSYEEFIKHILVNGLPSIISFDHDLADEHYHPETWSPDYVYQEKTGLDCAKWLIDYCLDNDELLPSFLVHSMNPLGGKNIRNLLENFWKSQRRSTN